MKVSIFVENLDKFESFLRAKILKGWSYDFRFHESGVTIVADCINTKIDEKKIQEIKDFFGTAIIEIYD